MIRQAKNLLFSFRNWLSSNLDKFPVITLLGHVLGTTLYIIYKETNYEHPLVSFIDRVNSQFCNGCLYFILLMLATSKHYRFISWASLLALFLLWIVSTIYYTTNLSADIYYITFVLIIYLIFAIGAVMALTRRC